MRSASTDLQSERPVPRTRLAGQGSGAARRRSTCATTDRDGVVTWVLPQEGALVRRGDVVARVADLSAFRVDATVSDVHAARLAPGMPAVVSVDDEAARRHRRDGLPDDRERHRALLRRARRARASALRNNLRVDVQVVTDRSARRCVPRGPFAATAPPRLRRRGDARSAPARSSASSGSTTRGRRPASRRRRGHHLRHDATTCTSSEITLE